MTYDVCIIPIPAIGVFGISFILFFLIVGLLERLYPRCSDCKGYGATNLKWWHKMINVFIEGSVGEKCKKCNGKGVINIYKLYKEQSGRGENKDV